VDEEITRELPPTGDGHVDGAIGADPDAAGELDDWPVRAPAKGVRLAVPAAALVAVLLLATGFWGGATLQKRHNGSGSSASSLASAFAGRLRAAAAAAGATGTTGTTGAAGATGTSRGAFGGAGGFGGFGGASTAAAAGTVSVVDGSTLYVLTADGQLVKVTLGPSTTITRNAKSNAVGLRPGDTVVVQGASGKNGNVTATSVSATAPGAGSAGGRFGGGGGFGGGGSGGSGGAAAGG
jgi:hypothetical protein